MKILVVILAISCCEWAAYYFLESDQFWYYLLCSKQLSVALGLQAAFYFAGDMEIRAKTLLTFLCCSAWLDVPLNIVWAVFGFEMTGVGPIASIIFVWILWIITRAYEIKSDKVNHDNVMILLLKPSSFTMIVKSFFGSPVSSVCIVAGGHTWSFRKSSKIFCKSEYNDKWLLRHICVDTGICVTDSIVSSLRDAEGANKGIGVRCVYTVRHALRSLGEPWGPRTVLQYIPGFYAMQILKGEK